MFWNGKKVLVTGAKGFVGRYLVNGLLQEGAEVVGLSTDGPLTHKTGLRWVSGDITQTHSLEGLCNGIDIVYHLAAISNVDASIRDPIKTFHTNAMGTANLLEESRKSNVKKFVYVSSAHVYGVPQYLPIDEKHPVVPREAYAASKIAAENIVQAYGNTYGMEYAILRPFNMFGPGQDPSFLIPGVIEQARCNKSINVGNMEPTRDFLFIEDAVRAFIIAGEVGNGLINIGSGQERHISEVVQKIREMIDPDINITSVDTRKRNKVVEIPRLCADVSILRSMGWQVNVGFEEGLTRTINSDDMRQKW
ncbi:NAD-dependent epimerase/dehydratase family protein [Methanocella sp. MCL-LM]|uniref:NAD-dependent epimerase/dehydratase family protein n=1 Tax=Methanocella sp. MCL-LM TaxID=3412035 RepID=UPI003C786155